MNTEKLFYLVYSGTKLVGTFLTPAEAYLVYKQNPVSAIYKKYVSENGHVCLVRWL